MSYHKKIATLTVLLAVVLALIAYVYVGNLVDKNSSDLLVLDIQELKTSSVEYIEVSKDSPKSTTKNIVTDRFSQKLDTNGQLIVINKDGSIKSVTSGVVLVNDNIVSVNQEESSIVVLENRN